MGGETERGASVPAPGPRMSRRQALGLGLSAAAAVAVELSSPAGPAAASAPGLAASLPALASRATVASGPIQRFRSRPDLAPAAVQVDISRPGQDPGLILMDSQGGIGAEGPMIIDGNGELVWFREVSATPTSSSRAFNLQVQRYRGEPVLTWFDGSVVSDHGVGVDVIMDRSYREIARVQATDGCTDDLHVFRLTPEGTALVSCYPLAYGDLRPVGGAANGPYVNGVVQELDVATGRLVFEWRADEHVAFDETYARLADYGSSPFDFFHVNSVDVAPDGDLIISARNTWTVYKVDRRTGAVRWRMGGRRSDFRIGPGAHFAWQHDVSEERDGAFTVFDNGAGDYRTELVSRGLVLKVDQDARTVSLQRQLLHPRTPLQAGALGSVQALPGGQVFVGWGLLAGFTEYGSDDRPLLDGRLAGKDAQSYRAFRSAWTGVPADAPSLATERFAKGTTLFVTWNGATEVAHWLVLGGAEPSALAPLGVAGRAGFETVIDLPGHPAHVAVAALDASGSELGRSQVHAP